MSRVGTLLAVSRFVVVVVMTVVVRLSGVGKIRNQNNNQGCVIAKRELCPNRYIQGFVRAPSGLPQGKGMWAFD